MGEANKDGVADILFSMRNNPINFLQRFKPQNPEISDSEQLDLSLGLSLGGFYSQIPEKKPLIRTFSLNGKLTLNENEGALPRSASVPTEAVQELRKLKEMQATKRMEAKRRLLEKNRLRRGGSSEDEKSLREAKLTNWAIESASKDNPSANQGIQDYELHSGPENLSAAKVPTISQPTVVTSRAMENGKSFNTANCHPEPVANFGTLANGKSAYPANYGLVPVVLDKMAKEKRVNPVNSHPDSAFSFMTRENGKPVEPAETEQERPSKKVKVLANGIQGRTMVEMMKLMPSVTTTGDGPNGRKIDGFLYKYMKGQVSIVCVCHGYFLSPAEFVKHAGGSDVANPMKHINVLPATL